MNTIIIHFSSPSSYCIPLRPKYLPQCPVLEYPQSTFVPYCERSVSHPYKRIGKTIVLCIVIQCVPLTAEPGISLIIPTPMKILQRNLNRSKFVVWEIKRNVSVVRFKFHCNILISGKIIKEMPGSVASGTYCICILGFRWETER